MSMRFDVMIAGGGLAGACAALALSERQSVLLLEAKEPAAGASGAAAGLVNPIMGRRPRLVWRVEEALAALDEVIERAGAGATVYCRGVVRPARDERQAQAYREAAREHPQHAQWWPAEQVEDRHPDVRAPHGAFFASTGLALDVAAFVRACLRAAEERGAVVRAGERVEAWAEAEDDVHVEVSGPGGGRSVAARRLVLATGQDYALHPALAELPLKCIKGQTVRVELTSPVEALPCLSGSGYVVPEDARTLVVGSTYEHRFDDLRPDAEQSQRIVEKTAHMVPALRTATVGEARAGARVKVPGSRYPLVDRLPGHDRVWVFTGLGSKGLLMAPMLARRLARELAGEAEGLPKEVSLSTRT